MAIYEQRLQADLDHIHNQIKSMGDLVETSINSAVKAFLTENSALSNHTVLSDNVINRKMREIDHDCHTFIARHLPSAGHLRLISSIIRLNIILERIGDYAVTISREALQFGKLDDALITEIDLIGNEAAHMLNQSLQSFYDSNPEMAKVTMNLSDHMEDTMDTIYANLSEKRELYGGKAVFALFATLTQLKRVTDQSRNICEETVFAVSGETKEKKIFNILFIDETNARLSVMAQSIGERHFSYCGQFSSAGRVPANSVDSQAEEFLQDHGLLIKEHGPSGLEFTDLELSQFHVIIALQSTVKSYFEQIPFHTAFIDWDFEEFPHGSNSDQIHKWYEQSYRELTHQITELMELLYGDESS